MALDLQAGYRSVLANRGWFKKVLMVALYSIIPVVGSFAMSGVLLDRIALVADGAENELPPRPGRFGEYLLNGLMVYVPMLLLGLICMMTFGLGFIVAIPFMLFFPAMMVHYLRTDRSFGSLFQFGEIWSRVKANSELYINFWLSSIIYSLPLSVLAFPLVFLAEMPMIMSMSAVNPDSSSSMAAGILLSMGLTFVMVFVVTFILVAASTAVSFASYYYLGLYARAAYPMAPAGSAAAVPTPGFNPGAGYYPPMPTAPPMPPMPPMPPIPPAPPAVS